MFNTTYTGSNGRIVGNIIRGGTLQLRGGPWQVLNNDFQGPAGSQECKSAIAFFDGRDMLIQGNHFHISYSSTARLDRLLVVGGSGDATGKNITIQDNIFDGGAGQIGAGNNAEVILTEGYHAEFEGVPAAISADGLAFKFPYAGDIGPSPATSWRSSVARGPASG